MKLIVPDQSSRELSPWQRLLKNMLGNSKKVLFLALLLFVLAVLAYYLGTTTSFRTGQPLNVRANTIIQYFSLNRATNEGRSPADRSTERERSFIERVMANRTWSENNDRETERVQSPTVRQKSFIEQVISNRSWSEKVNTERTKRTRTPTSRPADSDLLDIRSYLQQITTDLKANEAGSKTLAVPVSSTRATERHQSFIQQVLTNREGNEANKTQSNESVIKQREVPKTESSQSYIKQILRDRALDATRQTDIPESKRAVTISVDKLNIATSSAKQVVPHTEIDADLSTLESLTNAQKASTRSQKSAFDELNRLPVQKPPQQTSSEKSEIVTHGKPLQPPSLLSKRLFEQRDGSGPTYEDWHRQRLSNMCGNGWQEKYQQLHEAILNGRQEERYLVYSCPGYRQGCCGYGNRLRALASVFYLAILTGRAFLMDWQIPEPIDRHLVPKGIRWNYSEPLDMCSGPEFRRHYWGSTKSEIRQAQGWIIQDSSSFAKWFTSMNFSTYFEYPVEKITTIWYFVEKGVRDNPFLMARAKELQITPLLSRLPPYALIGCAFDFLFTVSDGVDYQLSSLRQKVQGSPAGPVIGIHVRTGDDQFDYYASENDRTLNVRNLTRLLRFFECAVNVERNVFGLTDQDASAVKWFVATDNPSVRTLARKWFPEKVVTSDLPILHLDILLNSTLSNSTVECHYADSTNTTIVCTDIEPFNRTIYCANRTNDTMSNSTVFNATEGIISMLVDHFLLAESDFLVLCDSSFGSTAVGLSMRESESYTFGDRGCADVKLAQRNNRLQFFKK